MYHRTDSAITASKLLHAFLNLQTLTPDLAAWTEGHLALNPPRLLRLRMLMAMFRAFQLPWDPVGFVSGAFINPDDPRHVPLLDRVAATMSPSALKYSGPYPHQIAFTYPWLFEYRRRLNAVLTHAEGVYEASGFFAFACNLAYEVGSRLKKELPAIDEVLAAIIDPDGRSFAVVELIDKYGYPDVQLGAIDMDWY